MKPRIRAAYQLLRERIGQRIVGLDEVVDLLLIGILSGGHCLLVGVPGLAKTLLISTLAELFDLKFSRIQFTPDLMPSDIVGTEVIVEDSASGDRGFRFMNGPIFANVVLADEVNRTPPKTQAALIEAMEERQVTIGGRRHPLEAPFFVLATQNPIEQEGTYPLPAAQLDRFMFLIRVDYPSHDEEYRIVRMTTTPGRYAATKLVTRDEIAALIDIVTREEAPPEVARLATTVARLTRPKDPASPEPVRKYVAWGVGPRGAQALVFAAKVRAALKGRPQASVEDVVALVPHAFRHRLVLNFHAEAEGINADTILADVLAAAGAAPAGRRATSRNAG